MYKKKNKEVLINKYLQQGVEPNLSIDLTCCTYATVLKRSGVNTSIISESLGVALKKSLRST